MNRNESDREGNSETRTGHKARSAPEAFPRPNGVSRALNADVEDIISGFEQAISAVR
jgi:hypothetical protein